MLGYCNALSSQANLLKYFNDLLVNEISILKTQLQQCKLELEDKTKSICNVQRTLRDLHAKKTLLGERERERKVKNVETLKCGYGGLKRIIQISRSMIVLILVFLILVFLISY